MNVRKEKMNERKRKKKKKEWKDRHFLGAHHCLEPSDIKGIEQNREHEVTIREFIPSSQPASSSRACKCRGGGTGRSWKP